MDPAKPIFPAPAGFRAKVRPVVLAGKRAAEDYNSIPLSPSKYGEPPKGTPTSRSYKRHGTRHWLCYTVPNKY